MKIEQIEALHLRIGHVEEKADGTQEVLVVRVTTDDGLVGHGEAVSNATVARAIIEAPRSAPFRHGLAVALIGRDPLDPVARWSDMYEASRWYGRRGAAIHAMAAIDTALWDIVGQAAGKSCSAIWGRRRSHIRAYASRLFPDTPAAAAIAATELAESGFTAIKFGWGSFGCDRQHDCAVLNSVRTAIGDRIDLMVDAGRVWKVEEAVSRARELFDKFRILWLEEPLREDDLDGYARLTSAVSGAIAAGETEETLEQFEALAGRGIRILQPDIGRAGGPTICRRLSSFAHDRGLWCVPHCFGTGVNLAASVQWMAAAEEAPFTEYPLTQSPLRNELVQGLPQLVDGQILVPDRPGLGISLDPAVIERYRVV
jgi:L-rhamnonate dehydratase